MSPLSKFDVTLSAVIPVLDDDSFYVARNRKLTYVKFDVVISQIFRIICLT